MTPLSPPVSRYSPPDVSMTMSVRGTMCLMSLIRRAAMEATMLSDERGGTDREKLLKWAICVAQNRLGLLALLANHLRCPKKPVAPGYFPVPSTKSAKGV